MLLFRTIGLEVRVFANGPGDLGSIPGRVIPKTQKMVLDASLLNTQHYKVRIKGKVEQSREGVAPSPTPWCSSYRKGSLRVTLEYGRQLYLLISDQSRPKTNGQKLQHYRSLIIRLFSFMPRILVRVVLPLCIDAVGVFCSTNRLGEQNDSKQRAKQPETGVAKLEKLSKWHQPV